VGTAFQRNKGKMLRLGERMKRMTLTHCTLRKGCPWAQMVVLKEASPLYPQSFPPSLTSHFFRERVEGLGREGGGG
jgi:hypothetical protein